MGRGSAQSQIDWSSSTEAMRPAEQASLCVASHAISRKKLRRGWNVPRRVPCEARSGASCATRARRHPARKWRAPFLDLRVHIRAKSLAQSDRTWYIATVIWLALAVWRFAL